MIDIKTDKDFYEATRLHCLVTPANAREFIGISGARWHVIAHEFDRWQFCGEIYVSLVQAIEYRMERKGKYGRRPNRTKLFPILCHPEKKIDNLEAIQTNGKAIRCRQVGSQVEVGGRDKAPCGADDLEAVEVAAG